MAAILNTGEAMDRALGLLAAGDVVAIPTETVYGLAADATRGEAVALIYEKKGRPRFNPLIAHVSSLDMARGVADFSPLAEKLAAAFWPGPLTLVLPLAQKSPVHPLATAGLDTVAVRIPSGFARDLIARLGRPLAAPSANRSGRVSATSAAAAVEEFGDTIPLVVDGGPATVGVESTIVKVADDGLILLRPGGLAAADIEAVAGRKLRRETGGAIQAPGMLASHYAPASGVRLNAREVRPGESLLAFGPMRAAGAAAAARMLNLSGRGDLREAAANLFSYLRRLDAGEAATIAVEPIPDEGLGEAINDRLARAAAPRPRLEGGVPE
ncbi:MAG: L-threonylcarbamoyladenylate synthase [Rhizobiaceae bacterium]